MRRGRLLWQIFLPMVLVIIVALGTITWLSARSLHAFFLEQTTHNLRIRTVLLRDRLLPFFLAGEDDRLNALCRQIGTEAETRITVILPSGVVVADSHEDPARMENHADRPEIKESLTHGDGSAIRYSHTLKQNMLYVAVPLAAPAGQHKREIRTIGVLRLAVSLATIDRTLHEVFITIMIGALVIVMIAAVVTLLVSRTISRPLEVLRQSAERFAQGSFDRPIAIVDQGLVSLEVANLAQAMNRMATELDTKIDTITRQKNEFETVLAGMVEAVIVLDLAENILSLNQAAEQLLGRSLAESLGRPLLSVLRNLDLERLVQNTTKMGTDLFLHPTKINLSPFLEDEIMLHARTGELFLQAHGSLLRDAKGNSFGVLLVLHDVTRLRRLETVRRDFVANVSHELKTPITAIKGFVETLRDGALDSPADAQRFLNIILKHADRLDAIVSDLLSLSRIEQEVESQEIELTPGPLCKPLAAAVETCLPASAAKDIGLVLSCAEDIRAGLNGPLFEQAITNLIVNAVKYSEPGSEVRIAARLSPDCILIEVTDHGVGISQEHLPRLFERFYRSDKARSRKLGGTGLGLAIVKHIVKAHRGEVSVTSTLGKGSTFTIRLPIMAERNPLFTNS